jgi:6-phosphogluconolactonase (cycloisomerase 2 family)
MRHAAVLAAAGALVWALAGAGPAGAVGATTFADLACLQDPSASPTQPCTSHTGLESAGAVGVSGDGRFVYVGTFTGQLQVFGRDAFGALHDVECLTSDGSGGACKAAPSLTNQSITDVEVAGSNVYVGTHDGVLAAFARNDQTGELTPLGCMAAHGRGTGCSDAQRTVTQTIESTWVAPTPNVVYAGGNGFNSVAITMYDRDTSGVLSQPSSITDKSYCVTYNGDSDQGPSTCTAVPWAFNTLSFAFNASATRAYATANSGATLIALDHTPGDRPLSNATCTTADPQGACPDRTAFGLDDPTDVVVSPSTGNVYVSSPSSSTVAAFRPDLSEIGCIAEAGEPNANGICSAQAHGIKGANALALSPDGKHLYVAGSMGSSVAGLSIGGNGELSQPSPTCVSSAAGSGCAADTALDGGGGGNSQWDLADALAVSKPNTTFTLATPSLYVAAPGSSALHTFSITAMATITLPTQTVKCTSLACQFLLRCSKAHNCSVATTITTTGIKPRLAAAKAKPVVVASGHFTVPKGKTKKLQARTTKAGRSLLKASRAHHRKKLRAQLTVKVKGEPGSRVFPVTLRP